jgi:hypothetical protein
VLELISDIADIDFQIRVWILGEGPECIDFDETVNFFFMDGEGVIEKYKEFGLTESQYLLLRKFRDEFRVFADEHYWPAEFINTPEWNRIINLAKDVLKAFNYSKSII